MNDDIVDTHGVATSSLRPDTVFNIARAGASGTYEGVGAKHKAIGRGSMWRVKSESKKPCKAWLLV